MDYDDEETDSDEDIRETYGYDMKVCRVGVSEVFPAVYKWAGLFFLFVFLILLNLFLCVCVFFVFFAGPRGGEALPVLR